MHMEAKSLNPVKDCGYKQSSTKPVISFTLLSASFFLFFTEGDKAKEVWPPLGKQAVYFVMNCGSQILSSICGKGQSCWYSLSTN